MKDLTGQVRAAIDKYNMISQGDTVAVGVSGGKDSMYLLHALASIRRYYPRAFKLAAVTIDPGFGGVTGDYMQVSDFCAEYGIEYVIHRSDLAHIIFEKHRPDNPCSLCARMRRGMLHNICREQGWNKIALGHHLDDAVQTFMMNLFYGGRISCFSPVTWLSRKSLFMIRPLLFCTEKDIIKQVNRLSLPVVKSKCPVDGITARKHTADLICRLENDFPDLKAKVTGAMQRGNLDGWGQ